MATTTTAPPSQMTILRRFVDADKPVLDPDVARAILRLDFDSKDRARMNRLAAKNRDGKLTPAEDQEFDDHIRVGQTLGILKSKARRSLKRRVKKSKSTP